MSEAPDGGSAACPGYTDSLRSGDIRYVSYEYESDGYGRFPDGRKQGCAPFRVLKLHNG